MFKCVQDGTGSNLKKLIIYVTHNYYCSIKVYHTELHTWR